MTDLEALRRAVLADLDGPLASIVGSARLSATRHSEEWSGIGLRQVVTLTVGVAAADLAELSFVTASYERTLRAFAAAMTEPDVLADLFVQYARPQVGSAYRGATPVTGGELLVEAGAYVRGYLAARGAPDAIALHAEAGTLVARGPRALGPRGGDLGARFGRGLSEIASAFQRAARFDYAAGP